MSEAETHFEFYRYFATEVYDKPRRNGIKFGDIEPEYGQDIKLEGVVKTRESTTLGDFE